MRVPNDARDELEPPPSGDRAAPRAVISCSVCGATLPRDDSATCPACGADLSTSYAVTARRTPSPGVRVIALAVLIAIVAMLVAAFWLLAR